jgi:hypothetical protein
MSSAWLLALVTACSYATIQPGHRGLRDREVLSTGQYRIGAFCFVHRCNHIDDFDVTFSTNHEDALHATSNDGASLEVGFSLIHRPIVVELYELRAEIGGTNYDRYVRDAIVPEARIAAIEVLARHSALELVKSKVVIEDEIESELRRRVRGQHIEISSITIEHVSSPALIGH